MWPGLPPFTFGRNPRQRNGKNLCRSHPKNSVELRPSHGGFQEPFKRRKTIPAVTGRGKRLTGKGLELKPFFLLAPSGTARHAQAPRGKKN